MADIERATPAETGEAQPERIGGCNCDWLEAENRRLWERAAQADYETTRADLRAARLRLVLASALRAFPDRRRFRPGTWRIGRAQDAELRKWRQIWEANRPVSELTLGSFYIGSDSRDDRFQWAYVTHEPCGTDVFSGEREPTNPDMGLIWVAMASHECPDTSRTDTGDRERFRRTLDTLRERNPLGAAVIDEVLAMRVQPYVEGTGGEGP